MVFHFLMLNHEDKDIVQGSSFTSVTVYYCDNVFPVNYALPYKYIHETA